MAPRDWTARELLMNYEQVEGRIPPVLRDWLITLLEGGCPDPKFDLIDLLKEIH